MKLRTITSRKGFTIPRLSNLRSGMPVEVENITSQGWQIHRRGPTLLFRSPPNKDTKTSDVYERHVEDFDLNWQLEDGEPIESVTKWDSHPAQEKKK